MMMTPWYKRCKFCVLPMGEHAPECLWAVVMRATRRGLRLVVLPRGARVEGES